MISRIRFLADSALLAVTLAAGGLVLYLSVPRARTRPVLHPVACHGCSANAPASAIAAQDAYLVRIGALELESPSDPE